MLVGILCRICRCLAGGPREREPSAKPAGDAVGEERTDTAPEARADAYAHTHRSTVEAMRAVDLATAGRRADVDRQLQATIPEAALRSFLLHNLVSEDGRLNWRINLAALAANMNTLTGYPEDLAGLTYGGPTHFLSGAASDYVREAHHARIRDLFPKAEMGRVRYSC